ncbi:PadR family transcriptional regulator [Micromonospora sp. HM5-17]|jgi:DNA-binding PadR family transcriptional regulator|uniref:PadR family transcriptional regulator n=1 Tax=Micromonospora sp. HM5-17 TaxID=2487710 RepID=UPI000F47DE17|nr:PadR family transcriptional regulator [Micromonospora sp. HM5-17]ROT32271.1 PadR family transcriptional regulator [Micromonospora sp. HM5-17]
MPPVFGHGQLRLYLLRLLEDGPKHGYELIRLLEERFRGLYAPSAGTIYPRLQRMESEGLVTHQATGGRKIYQITDLGRQELRLRADELAALESEIRASVADLTKLAGEIRSGVRDSLHGLRQELRAAARETRRRGREIPVGTAETGPYGRIPDPGWTDGTAPAGPEPADEFERRLLGFVAEVRALTRGRRLTDGQLRTSIRLLDGALDGLRRLLR